MGSVGNRSASMLSKSSKPRGLSDLDSADGLVFGVLEKKTLPTKHGSNTQPLKRIIGGNLLDFFV